MLRGSFPKMIWYAGNCCIIREHGGALHTMPAFARKASGYVFLWAIAPLVVADRIGGFIGKIVEARQDRPDTDGQGRAHQKPARAFSDEGVSNEKSRRTLFCDPVAADLGNGSHGRSGAFSAARSGVRKGRSRGALGP